MRINVNITILTASNFITASLPPLSHFLINPPICLPMRKEETSPQERVGSMSCGLFESLHKRAVNTCRAKLAHKTIIVNELQFPVRPNCSLNRPGIDCLSLFNKGGTGWVGRLQILKQTDTPAKHSKYFS